MLQITFCFLAINDSEIIIPNETVPLNRTNPNSIIMDMPIPPELFRYVQYKFNAKSSLRVHMYIHSHVWVVAVRLSSQDSFILSDSVDTNEEYPTRDSFSSYATAEDDEPYIAAEISQQNYPTTFALGDNSSTFSISDFPDLYINGPLMEGRLFSIFVRFFSALPPVS